MAYSNLSSALVRAQWTSGTGVAPFPFSVCTAVNVTSTPLGVKVVESGPTGKEFAEPRPAQGDHFVWKPAVVSARFESMRTGSTNKPPFPAS